MEQLQLRTDNRMDVMCVSDMCVDMVVTGNVRPKFHQIEQLVDDYSLELGGSANIFACQLAKLGPRVGVIGCIGGDFFGEFVQDQLQQNCVDTTSVKKHPSVKTGIGIALTESNDRAILTYSGTIDATAPGDIERVPLDCCRHWHIASYFLLGSLRAFWPRWIGKCRDAGLTISLDTNWDPENAWTGVLELLPSIDVFLPNEAEACALTGETDVWAAARCLAAKGPLTVVKLGEKGAIAVKGGEQWKIAGSECQIQPVSVVDSIGAGDNFDAGFIHGWLSGRDVDSCLRLGHRCALSSLGSPGGIRGQLREEVLGGERR